MPGYARLGSLAALTLVLSTVLAGAQPPAAGPPVPSGSPPAARAPAAAESFRSARTYPSVPAPVRLRIRALRVDSKLERLGLRADGTIAVPERTDVAGWWAGGPRPGQAGPAVILGHVDSRTGPGVFVGLSKVRRGTLVTVERADGSTVTFRVREVAQVAKTRFPTDLVYAPSLDPSLRLVTCGGTFDRAAGHYRDNVIVFASLSP